MPPLWAIYKLCVVTERGDGDGGTVCDSRRHGRRPAPWRCVARHAAPAPRPAVHRAAADQPLLHAYGVRHPAGVAAPSGTRLRQAVPG